MSIDRIDLIIQQIARRNHNSIEDFEKLVKENKTACLTNVLLLNFFMYLFKDLLVFLLHGLPKIVQSIFKCDLKICVKIYLSEKFMFLDSVI